MIHIQLEETNAKVASCTLNQWAMDFEHNKSNIMKSI